MGTSDYNYSSDSKGSKRTVFMVIIAILLLFNLFLLYKFLQKQKENKQVSEELVSTTDLKNDLETEIKNYETQMKEYEGKIDEQDSTLVKYRGEIDSLKTRIQVMIREGKITRSNYEKAKNEIEGLKYYITQYQNQIKELTEQNKELTNENSSLKTTISQNKQSIDKLEDDNAKLSNKVSLGSKFVLNSVAVTGIQLKENGKKIETNRGNKMVGLKISFKIADNIIADKGRHELFIKIINPKGETIYLENMGSGKFLFRGEESLYTIKEIIDFQNEIGKTYTVTWSKGSNFEKGDYKAEIYNSGNLIGEQKFQIK